MFRKLLISTAIVSAMSGVAIAQDKSATENHPTIFMTVTVDKTQPMWMSSNLVGKPVYTSAGASEEAIGEVNDLLLSADGAIEAAIIGVGGFLGIGEKDVAVSFDRLTFTPTQDGEVRVSVPATKEQLNNAEAFERDQIELGYLQVAEWRVKRAAQVETAHNSAATGHAATMTEAETISAEKLIGLSVYDAGESRVGEIGDVILAKNGDVDAVIVDVGGFLGLGEKPVAIGFDQLKIMRDNDNDVRLMSRISKEKLEGAMQYNKSEYEARRNEMRVQAQ